MRYTVVGQAFKWQQNWQQRGNRLATDLAGLVLFSKTGLDNAEQTGRPKLPGCARSATENLPACINIRVLFWRRELPPFAQSQ
jgi:hypothetical protein